MPTEKFGLDNIKQVAKIVFTTYNDLTAIFADGKIDFGEQFKLLATALNGLPLVKAIPALKNELKDLSTAEKTELRDFMVKEFSLVNIGSKALDALIKKTVIWALDGLDITEAWKASKKAK